MMLSSLLLVAYAGTPLISWLTGVFAFQRRIHWFVLFTISCVIGYGVLMLTVSVVNAELKNELARYDLDGDGGFSPQEMTPDAERAMNAVVSDTGRALAPITGIPITLLWTTLNFVAFALTRGIFRKVVKAFHNSDNLLANENGRTHVAMGPSDNPYQPPTHS